MLQSIVKLLRKINPRERGRLYVALYARGGSSMLPGIDTYHWALIFSPKRESTFCSGYRFRAKERIVLEGYPPYRLPRSLWVYDEEPIFPIIPEANFLCRVYVGKVKSRSRLRYIMRRVPIRDRDQGWNRSEWVREALETAFEDDALGICADDWESVRDTVLWYVQKKKADHRYDGRGDFDLDKIATWDMLEGIELIP